MKKILIRVVDNLFGLTCDAALIHNFFWKDGWNRYCDNYITFFKVLSWVALVCLLINLVCLTIAAVNDSFLETNRKMTEERIDRVGDLWTKIYYFANSLPMLLFVWVCVGDFHLGTVWGFLALFQIWQWEVAKRVRERLSKFDEPGDRLAELLNRPSLN